MIFTYWFPWQCAYALATDAATKKQTIDALTDEMINLPPCGDASTLS